MADNQDGPARSLEALERHRRPDLAGLTHQGDRWMKHAMAPACDRCMARGDCGQYQQGGTCVLAEAYQADVMAALEAEVDVTPALRPLAEQYAHLATAVKIVDLWIARSSPFLPGAEGGYLEGQPIMAQRDKWVSRMQALANDLGLTPAAKHRMKAEKQQDAGANLAKALVELQREQPPVLEGDFEVSSSDDQ